MADKVLADIAKKTFSFNIGDDMLTADSAYDKEGPPSPAAVSNNPVVDIVLAVVFTIILVIVIVVVVIIVVYCYR